MRVSFLIFVFATTVSLGQKKIEPTKFFLITGEVKSEKKISLDDLSSYRESSLGDVVITNHLGEIKSTQKKLKGILLRDVLEKVECNSELPKDLSALYIVCLANDGYTIVYSWNEIFNNPAGESIYIITSKAGISANDLDESILMISPRDYMTGRRYLKGLTRIEIRRAQ